MKTLNEFIMEEKLSADDRNEMDDSNFGIPETRSFPLNDADHVKAAVRMFPHADSKYKKALAKRILSKAKKYNLDTSGWDSLKEYQESFIYEEFVNEFNQIFLEGNKTQYQRTMDRWNYDPTTGTIKTDIPDPRSTTGETMRVKLVVDNTRGPFIRIPRDANGNRLYDQAEIHVPRKVLKSKGWNIDTIMKHEEGHMAAKMNRDQYSDDFDKAQQQIDANKQALMGNAHGNNPEEYVVDKYAAQHSRFGKRGAIKALQRTYNEVAKSSKASSNQINAMELLTVELRQHKISVNEYYKKQMDLLRDCQETLSVREGNLRALQKALVSECNNPKTVAYCNERIEAANADIARLKTTLENGCKEFDSDNEKFLSDPNTYNMLIDRVNARCKQMKIYDRDAKIKEGQLRVAFLQNNVQESVGPLDDETSGTSEFDESDSYEPDDCYTEADIFITEADKRFLRELQKKTDQIPMYELNKYGKKLMHYYQDDEEDIRNLVVQTKGFRLKPPTNRVEQQCHEYFRDLINQITTLVDTFEYGQLQLIKWRKYNKLIKTLFRSLGVNYNMDRVLRNAQNESLCFEEREFKKYTFDPNTDVLIHISSQKNLSTLNPSHCSRDGVIYPKPRIYLWLEKRDRLKSPESYANEYGGNVYVLNTNRPFEVYHDMEFGRHFDTYANSKKLALPVFINTSKPMKVMPLEQFMNDHVTESYYTENAKHEKMMKVPAPDSKYVYFASPENYMPEMKLDRPLFVTPYKSIASIFISRDMGLQNRIPKGSYNMQYEEWLKFNKKESGRCLKDVHVYVEGYPDLEPYEIKQTGHVHQILTHNWNDNYYRYPWMDASKEWLIANGNDNVEFDDVTKCEITYHVSGKPGHDKLGPRQDALESFVKHAIKLIHAKYKKDQKDPIGNQNCLLCTWCFEARMRGLDVLPRPVYSPRDDVLDIPGNQIVFSSRQIKLKNYTDLASEITKAGDGCRFYVHVNWKDSKGGHEFILMRIDGKNYVVDPQQGKIEPLTKSHNYVSDINYDNSYIVQLSDKKFNRNLFEKWNNSGPLLWDPEKDIPYMLKEGMITKEEAEKELRKSSTERFTSELKRELKNNPVQESKTDIPMKKVSILYKRWCVDNGEQYEKIARFWDIVEQYVNCDYLQGYGTAWTSDNGGYFTYGIIFKKGTIPNDLVYAVKREFPDMKVSNTYSVPSKYDHTFNGKTKDIDTLYDKIWSKGPLAYELEECRSDGTCSIHVIYKADVTQEAALPKRIRFRPATESDIPNIRKWKLESINKAVRNKPNVLKFIEKDCYDNLKNTKMVLDGKDVIGMLEACYIDDGEWWYIGEIYIDEAHRGKGIGTSILKQEIKRHDRLILRVAKDNQKAIKLYRSLGFTISKDEKFSWIMTLDKSKPVQEGVIQNIKNKVSPFEKNLVYHISPEGHLDGQVFKPRVPDYLDKYDPSKTEFEDVETPRVCFSPSIEGCLNAIIVNIGRWKTAEKLRDWYVYIPEKPLKEYKYRTNKQLVDEKKVYDANLTKEIWIEEPVRLKQYGVIRIDSVTDKSRKNAVPTTLGESKKRNVYDFKWHWLVKPKVLKDVPYDYSPLEVCKDMVADLESYKYGIPENGRIVDGSGHDYDTKWKLQSPEEFEKNGGGICYDFVEFEEGYLDAYGIKCKKYFMSTDLPGHDTHTFILVEDGKGGFIYPESSFEKVAGTHEVKSIEEAFKIVANGYWKFNDNINKVNEFKYYVWEFTGHPEYGSSIQKCIEYYSKGEPIFESRCLKPGKSQPIREFVTYFRNR